jgi:hypothetical protein
MCILVLEGGVGMAKLYGSDDTWPRHPKPWFRAALEEARTAGWSLYEFSAHTWGRVICPAGQSSGCVLIVYSTGRGGESVARELSSLVRRCPHGDGAMIGALTVARRQADKADRLVTAAVELWQNDRRRDRALEVLDLAAESAEEADELFRQAIYIDADARAAAEDLVDQLTEAGLATLAEARPASLARRADDEALVGQQALRGVTGGGVRALRGRLLTIRARVADLRRELGDPS